MTSDISNKTLAILLVLTIAVSLGGSLISLNRLNNMELLGITGFDVDVDEGNVEATVTSNTAINFTTSSVSFGSGTVSSECNNCTMWTPDVTDATCCNGLAAPDSGLVIENIGNRNVSLNLNFSNDADAFMGGGNPNFDMNITEGEGGSCANTSVAGSGLHSIWKEQWGDVPTDNPEVCDLFHPEASADQLIIDIKVRIPDDSFSGETRNTTVTATATTV